MDHLRSGPPSYAHVTVPDRFYEQRYSSMTSCMWMTLCSWRGIQAQARCSPVSFMPAWTWAMLA